MNENETTTDLTAVYDAVADGGQARLDGFWSTRLAGKDVSRGKVQAAIEAGLATVDGAVCRKAGHKLRGGETLTLALPETPSDAVAEAGALRLVAKDDHLLVLDKPPGLTVHPAPGFPEGTLVNRLLHHFPDLRHMAGQRPGIVHRLDKDTSGLMIVALTEAARLALSADFAARRVSKTYLALVHGRPNRPAGAIDLPMGRDPRHPTRMAVVEKGGRAASTTWKLVWSAPDGSASLLEVAIATGRTHQIRVHLASIGHPILGDVVYGARQHAEWTRRGGAVARLATRQMLHAWKLEFTHPATGEAQHYCLPPPRDFWRLLLILGRRCQRVGVVGMPGCGKSTLLGVFAGAGFPVFSADAAVAALYAPGGGGAHMLSRRYGEAALADDGSVNKAWLLEGMSGSEKFRREVCELIHPLVKGELAGFAAAHARARAVFAEVPLLFESGWPAGEMVDMVVGVRCAEAVRAKRLAANRGWAPELMARLDGWQWDQEKKMAKCRFVVDNDGDAAALAGAGRDVLAALAGLRRRNMAERFAVLVAAGYAAAVQPMGTTP
ncbi:MAG: dephospho-CoA kinase [Acidobacteriota bacterium]